MKKKSNKLKIVIVKRSKWRRGGDSQIGNVGPIQLLNCKGFRCCLGFAAPQLGYKGVIRFVNTPASLDYVLPGLSVAGECGILDSDFSEKAMEINDDDTISDKKREAELKKLTIKHKVPFRFKFVD